MVTGIVCVLDALGTKGVWSLDEPQIYLERLRLLHKNLENMQDYSRKQGALFKFSFSTLSDTIIITADYEDHEDETMIPLMARVIDGLLSHCFASDMLMRGAMSYGKFITEGNIIIGPAIDDAAKWHDQAQLVGCLLTPNATLLYDVGLERYSRLFNEDYDYSQHAIRYPTPMKNGLTYDLYQVNWPLSYHKALKDLSPPDTLLMLKQTLGKYPIPAEAYEKHQNTLAFYMSSLKQRDY